MYLSLTGDFYFDHPVKMLSNFSFIAIFFSYD